MLEVTTIEWEPLRVLAGMAMYVGFHYSDMISPRNQKRARKKLEKLYEKQIAAFPDELRSAFSSENSDQSVMDFLRACREECDLRIKENRTPQGMLLAPLGEAVQRAMAFLLEEDGSVSICHLDDGKVELLEDMNAGYRCSVVLEDPIVKPECASWDYVNDAEIQREGDWYLLCAVDDDGDREVLRFTRAHVEVTSYNCASEQFFWDDPWQLLHSLAWCITSKANLDGDYCNAREKALLPLLQEIQMIGIPKSNQTYPMLTQLAREVGCNTPKFEKMVRSWNRKSWNQVSRVLCNQEWEPLWREIYCRICHSQEEYPCRVEQRCKKEDVEQTRRSVEEYLHSRGFAGQYPDFVKKGPIAGMHLQESYDMAYFVGREKNATMYIHCVQTLGHRDRVAVQFLCGVASERKGNATKDVFSCLFDCKGRRYFRWVRDYVSYYAEEIQPLERTLKLAAVAVKKVQMQKLTKEEKELYTYGSSEGLTFFFLWWFLIGGLLFAIAMTVGMWLVCALVMALFGYGSQIFSVLSDLPWHYAFVFAWLGFGLPMGIISILAKRK